jgi:hypothetical protein
MITQTLDNPSILSRLIVAPAPNGPSEQPIFAASHDYGFDFDADELGLLQSNASSQPMLQVTADEFESCYYWFIS